MAVDLTFEFQSGAAGTGNGEAAGVNGLAAYSMDIQLGGATATITFEGLASNLGVGVETWRTIGAYPVTGGVIATTAGADGIWIVPCAGLAYIRARISAYTGPGTGVYVQGYGSYVPRW